MKSPKPQNADAVMSADAAALVQAKRDTATSETTRVPRSGRPAPGGERLRVAPQAGAGGEAPPDQGALLGGKLPPVPPGVAAAPAPDHLVGLAFSGGGIRSATFSLGVLQRLAMLDHLGRIDLLSSVSGGGYISAWLSAWIKRAPSLKAVNDALKQCPESSGIEPAQVQWLRRYSNYLTPRVGALSLDALTVAATYVRNVLLNLTILTACVSVLVLIPMLLIQPALHLLGNAALAGWLAVIFGSIALLATALQLSPAMSTKPVWAKSRIVYASVVAPGFLSAYFGSPWLATAGGWEHWPLACGVGVALVIALMALATVLLAIIDGKNTAAGSGPLVSRYTHWGYVPATLISVPVGFAMLYGLAHAWLSFAPQNPMENAALMLMAGPPLLVGVVALTVTLWIGLMGRAYPEMYREWWSRVGGALIAICAAWIAWCALAIFIPAHLKAWVAEASMWVKGAMAAGWFGALGTVLGLVRSFSGSATATKTLPPLANLAAVLASVVLIALAIAVACFVHALLGWIGTHAAGPAFFDNVGSWTWLVPGEFSAQPSTWLLALPPAWVLLLISIAVAALLGWRVDINRFSLHDMYKNRLIRCYLGASNAQRAPNLFTGFDPADDIALADLAPLVPGATPDEPLRAQPQRPFHIFNTALNLVHGSELAWQERKAALFVLTPTFCGFNLAPATGDKPLSANTRAVAGSNEAHEQAFRPTALYGDSASGSEQARYTTHAGTNMPMSVANGNRTGFTLGMAMATSGAAVSPNMGANSQPALAMLMTIFNIRLGRWCPNPAGTDWRRASPRSNLAWLIAEATGNTNESSSYVYLSDGGHFENTAVYELVRRRCSHIVMVDAGADPTRAFEDVGNLIRKCRVDLAAEIDLNIADLYALPGGRSKAGFITGTVTYAAGPGRATGKILLIKPTLGEALAEPADIYNYARGDGTFPQQTTLDQWFDESQFESYRFLGSALTGAAFEAHADFFS